MQREDRTRKSRHKSCDGPIGPRPLVPRTNWRLFANWDIEATKFIASRPLDVQKRDFGVGTSQAVNCRIA
jgi:hypothetical protein